MKKSKNKKLNANHSFSIEKNAKIPASSVEDLRLRAGWEPFGKYDKVMQNSYAYYSITHEGKLIRFLNVISDGIADAFLLDLLVDPKMQRSGLGKALVKRAAKDLTEDGIQCIQVTFAPELEEFYKKCGFHIFKAGIIDNKHPHGM